MLVNVNNNSRRLRFTWVQIRIKFHSHLLQTFNAMKTTKLYLILLLATATLFLYSCESVTNSAPQDDNILTQGMTLDANKKKAGADVCHYDAELDAYELLNIAAAAVDAHINHGDALPGEPVPTMEGFEFDETCTPKPIIEVVEITACFAIPLKDAKSTYSSLEDLVYEDLQWSLDQDEPGYFRIVSTFQGVGLILQVNFNNPDSGSCDTLFLDVINATYSSIKTSDLQGDINYLRYLLELSVVD